MNKKIMLFLSLMINLIFLNFNNPLMMGFLMMMQSMMLILMMGKLYYSFWFAYIMFLVFIGGLFILFVYIISLIYNNKFYLMKKMNYLLFSLILLLLIKYKMYYLFNYETNMLFNKFMFKDNYYNSLKLYNFPNNFINMLLILYLLLLMIIVVKITNFNKGPIRSMN